MDPSRGSSWIAASVMCAAGAVALIAGGAMAQDAATMPDLLYEVDPGTGARSERSEALWVSASRAFPNGDSAGGYFKGRRTQLVQQQATDVATGPFAGESRRNNGECRYSYSVGGGPRSFANYREYVDASALLLAGTIEESVAGFLLGRLATFYALRVDTVIKGASDLLGEVIWVPHLTVDLQIDGHEVCYASRSYPHTPTIGKRASIGIPNRPMRLVGAEDERPVVFAGAYVEGWLWFQKANGGAYVAALENNIEPSRWNRVERRLQAVARSRTEAASNGSNSSEAPGVAGHAQKSATSRVTVQVHGPGVSPTGVVVSVYAARAHKSYSRDKAVGPDGVAVFRDVPRGRVRFTARSDGLKGYKRRRIEAAEEVVPLLVEPLVEPYGHLTGLVFDQDGQPAGRMSLEFRPRRHSPIWQGRREVITDSEGRFEVPYLGENNYWIVARGGTPMVAALPMPAGQTLEDARIDLRTSPSIRVRLTGSAKEAPGDIAPWRLVATEIDRWGYAFRREGVDMVRIGDRYEAQVTPGRWGIFATTAPVRQRPLRDQQRIQLGELDVPGMEDVDVDLAFEPPRSVAFSVRLTGAGAPLPGSGVKMVPIWPSPARRGSQNRTQVGPRGTARVGADGQVTFVSVFPGEAAIQYRACVADCDTRFDHGGIVNARVRVPDDNGQAIEVGMVRLAGRLTLNGVAVAGAEGRVESEMKLSGCWSHDSACDFSVADGEFVTPLLGPGPYRLSVWFWDEGTSRRHAASHHATASFVVDPLAAEQPMLDLVARPRELLVTAEFPARPRPRGLRLKFCRDPDCLEPVIDDSYSLGRKGMNVTDVPVGDWLVDAWSGYEWVRGVPVTIPGPPLKIRFTARVGRLTALVPELYGVRNPLKLTLSRLDSDAATAVSPGCETRPWWQGDNGSVIGHCLPPGVYLARVEAIDGRVWEKKVRVRALQPGLNYFRDGHLVAE